MNCFNKYILFSFLVSLVACSGAVSEKQTQETKSVSAPGVGLPSTVPPTTDDSSDGNINVDDSDGGSGGGSGNGSGGGGGSGGGIYTPPEITVLNLKGGEFLQGGSTFKIYFQVSNTSIDNTVPNVTMSTIEYQRPSDAAANVWRLIKDKVVTNSGETVSVDWGVCAEGSSVTGCTGQVDGTGFKIRITSLGSFDQTTIYTSQAFMVDSTKPSTANSTISVSGVTTSGARVVPFIEFTVTGLADTISGVDSVCVKDFSTSEPNIYDSCWLSLKSLGISESLSPASLSFYNFFGFESTSSIEFYLWAKDRSGNISALNSTLNKDKFIFNYTAPAASTTTGYWNASADAASAISVKTDASASATIKNYSGMPANNLTTMVDPGSMVVSSKGVVYIKDSVNGIVAINPLTESRSILIPIKASLVEGLLSNVATGLKNPLRIAIDKDDGLWILDENHLAFIDLTSGTPSLAIKAGGGVLTDDELSDAKTLQISYHDNNRWYGTFQVLPNKNVVFSAGDTHVVLDSGNATTSFKLRVFNNSENKIETIYFSGFYTKSSTDYDVSTYFPFGPIAVTFNFEKQAIENFYGRFCSETNGGNNCTPYLLKFNNTGTVVSEISLTQTPYLYNNFPLIVQNGVNVFALNGIKSFLFSYDIENDSWSKIIGYNARASSFCNNGTASTSCNVRFTDAFVHKNGTVYFMDQTRIRVLDRDGSIQTIYQPAL